MKYQISMAPMEGLTGYVYRRRIMHILHRLIPTIRHLFQIRN